MKKKSQMFFYNVLETDMNQKLLENPLGLWIIKFIILS